MVQKEMNEISEKLKTIESLLTNQKTVFNFNDLAQYTGLSKSHLYKLTSTNKIPHYKPNGKYIYFEKLEIDEWLLRNRNTTQEEAAEQAANFVVLGNSKD